MDGSTKPVPSADSADAGARDAGGGPDAVGTASEDGSAAASADGAALSDPSVDAAPGADPADAPSPAPAPDAAPGADPADAPAPAPDAAPGADPADAPSSSPPVDPVPDAGASDPDADRPHGSDGAFSRDPPPVEMPWPTPAVPSAAPPPSDSSRAGIGRGMLAAVAAAAFVAGIAAAGAGAALFGAGPDSTTNDELAAMIGGLRDDLAPLREAAGPQPPPAPRSPSVAAAAEALSDDDPSKGDPDAPITIVEFSDFQCPFCGRFYEQTLPLVERDYIETGKARLVFRDMPLDIHPQAPPAHIAAECADEQGRFWEYHDVLFDRQGEWSRLSGAALDGALAGYAADLGLDGSFAECVLSPEAEREMRLDYEQALGMGLTGTPTFLIGGNGHDFVAISGAQPYSTFASILDGML